MAKELAEAGELTELVFVSLFYLWRIAAREKQTKVEIVYRERLRYFRTKIDSRCGEVEEFEREMRVGGEG